MCEYYLFFTYLGKRKIFFLSSSSSSVEHPGGLNSFVSNSNSSLGKQKQERKYQYDSITLCTNFGRDVLHFFRDNFLKLFFQLCCKCSAALNFSLKYPKGVLLHSSHATFLTRSLHFDFRMMHDFGHVLQIVIMLKYSAAAKLLKTENYLVCQYFGISTSIHGAIKVINSTKNVTLNVISPTPFTLMMQACR